MGNRLKSPHGDNRTKRKFHVHETKKTKKKDSTLQIGIASRINLQDDFHVQFLFIRYRHRVCRLRSHHRKRQDAELERKVNELHQDNSEVKKALRQRDENNTLELQNVVRNSFRQMDFTSELKKTINNQIKEY